MTKLSSATSQQFTKAKASKAIKAAAARVSAGIVAQTDRSNKFSTGQAYEGYQGGYLDALRDVQLVLNGIRPNTRGYWEDMK